MILNREVLSELKAEEADILPLSFPSISRSTKGSALLLLFFSINRGESRVEPGDGDVEEEKREVVGELFVVLFLFKEEKILYSPAKWAEILRKEWGESPCKDS